MRDSLDTVVLTVWNFIPFRITSQIIKVTLGKVRHVNSVPFCMTGDADLWEHPALMPLRSQASLSSDKTNAPIFNAVRKPITSSHFVSRTPLEKHPVPASLVLTRLVRLRRRPSLLLPKNTRLFPLPVFSATCFQSFTVANHIPFISAHVKVPFSFSTCIKAHVRILN
jgi:hypothetical protein